MGSVFKPPKPDTSKADKAIAEANAERDRLAKERADLEAQQTSEEERRKRRQRGRASLFSGSETGYQRKGSLG